MVGMKYVVFDDRDDRPVKFFDDQEEAKEFAHQDDWYSVDTRLVLGDILIPAEIVEDLMSALAKVALNKAAKNKNSLLHQPDSESVRQVAGDVAGLVDHFFSALKEVLVNYLTEVIAEASESAKKTHFLDFIEPAIHNDMPLYLDD